MSVAATESVLKRRIDDYLWRDKSAPLAELRAVLEKYFLDYDEVVIIGGMVRDIARKGQTAFRSDIDLVIGAEPEKVAEFANAMNAKPNRFGGFSIKTRRWKIDFWALASTWAFTQGVVDGSEMRDLLACTFFDWDAALYDIKSRKTILADGYLSVLRSSQLEINLLHTPSVEGNLLRAIRRIMLWNVEPGPRLASFIRDHLDEITFQKLIKLDKNIFSNPLLYNCENDFAILKSSLFDKSCRIKIATWYADQLIFKDGT